MAIGPGTRVGPYEVTSLLGEGGMGQVWRARHTVLKRDDALKVLPDTFAADPERLDRFQREAQILASLNHPNIAVIRGLEESVTARALVMELVEGPKLADRIAHGPLPIDESLSIAKQIASTPIHKAQPAATMKISQVTSGAVTTMAAPQIRSPR